MECFGSCSGSEVHRHPSRLYGEDGGSARATTTAAKTNTSFSTMNVTVLWNRCSLDSHVYWQLSDQHYRSNADVLEPGSDDPKQAEEIEACRELAQKLNAPARKV